MKLIHLFKVTKYTNIVVTAGADKCMRVFDIGMGFKQIGKLDANAVVTCGTVHNNVAVAGCGDGNVIFYNTDEMKVLYGFGAIKQGPVNCLKLNDTHTRLVVGGENGHGLVLHFG